MNSKFAVEPDWSEPFCVVHTQTYLNRWETHFSLLSFESQGWPVVQTRCLTQYCLTQTYLNRWETHFSLLSFEGQGWPVVQTRCLQGTKICELLRKSGPWPPLSCPIVLGKFPDSSSLKVTT